GLLHRLSSASVFSAFASEPRRHHPHRLARRLQSVPRQRSRGRNASRCLCCRRLQSLLEACDRCLALLLVAERTVPSTLRLTSAVHPRPCDKQLPVWACLRLASRRL